MNPLVSIITVTFNASGTIEETIQSVLHQSYSNYEFLVIDGGSGDGTVEAVKKHTHKINLLSEKDEGIYHAMNKGIERSKGEWLYFLNAGDTLFDAHVLEKIFTSAIPEDIELIYGDIKTKNHPSGSDYTIGHSVKEQDFHYHAGLCHQAAFMRRRAFKDIGKYEYADFPILADQEWFVRFLKSEKKALYLHMTIANYEIVGESYIKRIQNHEDHLKIVKRHFGLPVKFINRISFPFVRLKIKLLKSLGGSGIYKLYRKIFFRD